MEVVEKFQHLGSTNAQDCLLVLWFRKNLKVMNKPRLFKVVVLATLLYGRETWVPLAAHMKNLQAFFKGCLLHVL